MSRGGDPEVWKDVIGYEGLYMVSSEGSVRSIDREVPSGRGRTRVAKGIILRPGLAGNGYYTVHLWKSGKGETRTVHTLVASSFLGPRPRNGEVCHGDGDRLNNRASNLRYDTRSENLRDAVKHGTNWQSAKTACPRGHPFTPFNLGTPPGRHCRSCSIERSSAWRANREFDPSRANTVYWNLESNHREED